LFLSSAAPALLREVAGQFDYVMLDSAPVMAADDVTSLAPHTEGVLFVLRAGFTSGRVARAAIDLLYQREVPVLGLVFNSVQAGASDYYYYHYKDYYATYPSA
jgi:polysaccharide biosynthesis transport protein